MVYGIWVVVLYVPEWMSTCICFVSCIVYVCVMYVCGWVCVRSCVWVFASARRRSCVNFSLMSICFAADGFFFLSHLLFWTKLVAYLSFFACLMVFGNVLMFLYRHQDPCKLLFICVSQLYQIAVVTKNCPQHYPVTKYSLDTSQALRARSLSCVVPRETPDSIFEVEGCPLFCSI